MKKFVFRAYWSQTDQDCYFVEAASIGQALEKCKNSGPLHPHHWDFVCEIKGEIE